MKKKSAKKKKAGASKKAASKKTLSKKTVKSKKKLSRKITKAEMERRRGVLGPVYDRLLNRGIVIERRNRKKKK